MIEGWNLIIISLGIKIFILNSIEGQVIIDSHWFMKDEEATDWRERFLQLPLDKENKFKEGSWKAWVRRIFWYLVFFLGKRRRMNV
jgi:hypothetical protein